MTNECIQTARVGMIVVCVTREQQAGRKGRSHATRRSRFFSYSNITLRTVTNRSKRSRDHSCKGLIRPIQRVTAPDVAQLSPALGNFSSIIGKLVVSFQNPDCLVRMIPSAPTVNFDSESYYVITGGLGGLGQPLIRWMGDRGVRHLALLSRRDITSVAGAKKLVESLASHDIRVECFVCDVSKRDQVVRVIQQISSSRPIKGIVHAAVSYLDLTFDKLSASR